MPRPTMPDSVQVVPSLASIPLLLVAAAIFVLGIVVLVREGTSGVSVSFVILTLSVSTWLSSVSLMAMVTDACVAFALARVAYVGIAIIPAAVLQFTVSLLAATQRWKRLLAAAWCASGVFVILFTTTRLLLTGTWRYSWGFYPRLAPASGAFLLFFAALLGGSLALLAKTATNRAEERRRRVSFLAALAVGYVGSIDYLPAFGIPIYPIGFVAILGFLVLAARAVLRFRLTDLSPSLVAEQLLSTMHGGVIVVDSNGRVRVVNDVAAELIGRSRDEMEHADLRALLGVSVLPMTDTGSFRRRSTARNRNVTWRRGDGSLVELSLSATALRDANGEDIGILYAVADVADRRRAERNEFDATHDPLTRVPNRSHFAEVFEAMKERIVASGRVPALFFLDLDGFKEINDRHGHGVGDALLRIVAARMRHAIRGDDVLARYGGDEFVVLLDLARMDDAALVGSKLLRVVSEPYSIDNQRVRVTASIGAAFFPRDGANVDALVTAADAAMYGAKRAGKARIEIQSSRTDVEARPPYSFDARA